MNNKVASVTLQGNDSCYSYALKRTQKEQCVSWEPEALLALANVTVVSATVPEVGDLLLWNERERLYLPRIITRDCVIIDTKVDTGLHFAVMEENGLISDCIHGDDGMPIVRLRRLCDIYTSPDIVRIQI